MRKPLALLAMALALGCQSGCNIRGIDLPSTDRVAAAREKVRPRLGAFFGDPVFIRIIKEARALELWVRHGDRWQVLKSYPVLAMSGELGPKQKEGDRQAPEGFYEATPESMNPRSRFHLAFNIGYPNAYDRSLGRTGSFIMVHGSDASVGCFAMGDDGIDEIYTLVNESFRAGSASVPVQVYPFAMTDARMELEKENPHAAFWRALQPGWRHTEKKREPYPAP